MIAWLGSSLAFAAAHIELAHVILVLPLGLWFGWLRRRTDSLWPSLAAELKKELPAQQYDTWIKPLRAERQEDQLVLVAPNHHVLRWVRSNLLAKIETRVERLAAGRLSVNLVLDERPADAEIVLPEPVPVSIPPDRPAREEHRLNPGFTFANFVNGKANQIARAAAIQVAESPGTAYNPLFIYGGTGLGKTHLLQAIGTEVLKRNPRAKVRYIHAEQFVADVVRAYQHKSFDSLKRYYRSLDLFLIDDVSSSSASRARGKSSSPSIPLRG
jgi:chromosomal replication initiator protein